MGTKKIKIEVEVFSTMWDRAPQTEVLLNETIYFKGPVQAIEQNPLIVNFEEVINEGEEHSLIIKLTNKDHSQTVCDKKGNIIKDQLLHIKRIKIHDVDLSYLLFEGEFFPEYTQPWMTDPHNQSKTLPKSYKSTVLGHNGSWKYKFSIPLYKWFLTKGYE